mmetsp:Transcript_16251/g.38928  ORF Transcript_16251/g.38928 Transcript_16251/m.38928 type:complete len:200 (-) Transcript_16251:132-731(-)
MEPMLCAHSSRDSFRFLPRPPWSTRLSSPLSPSWFPLWPCRRRRSPRPIFALPLYKRRRSRMLVLHPLRRRSRARHGDQRWRRWVSVTGGRRVWIVTPCLRRCSCWCRRLETFEVDIPETRLLRERRRRYALVPCGEFGASIDHENWQMICQLLRQVSWSSSATMMMEETGRAFQRHNLWHDTMKKMSWRATHCSRKIS